MTFNICCVQTVSDDEQRDHVVVGGARATRGEPGARPTRSAPAGPRPTAASLRRAIRGEDSISLFLDNKMTKIFPSREFFVLSLNDFCFPLRENNSRSSSFTYSIHILKAP